MDKIVFSIFNLFNYISNNIFRIGAAVGEFQMVRKDIFEKVGGYDEKLVASEDYDFFRKISKVGKTYFAKDIVIYHTGRRAHKIEEHTSELQSPDHLVCRLLLEKKKTNKSK